MKRAPTRYGRSPRTIKHLIERALVGTGLNAVGGRRRVGQTLVLAFHNIVPHGERSYALPGHRTNERESAPSAPGTNSST